MNRVYKTAKWLISALYCSCAIFLVLILQGGCATGHTIEHYGMVDERFYGLGPVHSASNLFFVQGITQVIPEGGPLREHPSYVVLTVLSNQIVATDWIDPGHLPESTLTLPLIPYQKDVLRGARDRFDDLRASGAPAKYYGGNWLLIRNPNNPETPFQFSVGPSRRYRAKSAYPMYAVIFAGSVVFDVVTSPFQLIGYFVLNKAYENWN